MTDSLPMIDPGRDGTAAEHVDDRGHAMPAYPDISA